MSVRVYDFPQRRLVFTSYAVPTTSSLSRTLASVLRAVEGEGVYIPSSVVQRRCTGLSSGGFLLTLKDQRRLLK